MHGDRMGISVLGLGDFYPKKFGQSFALLGGAHDGFRESGCAAPEKNSPSKNLQSHLSLSWGSIMGLWAIDQQAPLVNLVSVYHCQILKAELDSDPPLECYGFADWGRPFSKNHSTA